MMHGPPMMSLVFDNPSGRSVRLCAPYMRGDTALALVYPLPYPHFGTLGMARGRIFFLRRAASTGI